MGGVGGGLNDVMIYLSTTIICPLFSLKMNFTLAIFVVMVFRYSQDELKNAKPALLRVRPGQNSNPLVCISDLFPLRYEDR